MIVGVAKDKEGDHIWISEWGLADTPEIQPSWINLNNFTSLTADGIEFQFSPSPENLGEIAKIQYVLQDGNVVDPKSASYSFIVAVLNETDSM